MTSPPDLVTFIHEDQIGVNLFRKDNGSRFARIEPEIHMGQLGVDDAEPGGLAEGVNARCRRTLLCDLVPHGSRDQYLAKDRDEQIEDADAGQVNEGSAVSDDQHAGRSSQCRSAAMVSSSCLKSSTS